MGYVPALTRGCRGAADGDGRGEQLVRQTTDAGRGWVIYRATADKLWKMYDSLNPE